MTMVLDIIRQTVSEYNLLQKGDSVLIGLSGGADSVCLTHALYSLKDIFGIKLYTVHINHGIRGEEAERDQKFAADFSKSLGIKCFIIKLDIPQIASKNGDSEETAGRKARYEIFDRLCVEHNITKIATAHNKNDNAETILMNFMRGSSVKGLCGIPCRRDNIIRPILNVSRDMIEEYCKYNNLEYVTDSTNLSNDYTRNKIRNILIPMIRAEFNPNFIGTVTSNAQYMYEDSECLDSLSERIYKNIVHDGSVLIDELKINPVSVQRRVIRYMLIKEYGGISDIPSVYINDILKLKNTGAYINLADNVTAMTEYGRLKIGKFKENEDIDFEYVLSIPGGCFIPELSVYAEVKRCNSREKDGALYLGCDEAEKLIIRTRRAGDRFSPCGMNGSKKVKQYFIDNKIPKQQRNRIPIIEINGKIAAVGSRVDNHFLFKDKGVKINFNGR